MGNGKAVDVLAGRPALPAVFLLSLVWLHAYPGATPLSAAGGRIIGTVTADRGEVKGFRIKARDTVNRIMYTTFSKAGRYRFVDLPASDYEIWVLQQGFESPVEVTQIRSGETQRVDLALTALERPRQTAELVDYDTLYPPGPGRKEVEVTCMGCHPFFLHRRKLDEAGWKAATEKMRTAPTWNGRTSALEPWPAETVMEPIYKYLATHFGPNAPNRDIKRDEIVPDEDALADALYIEYEIDLGPVYRTPERLKRPDRDEYASGHRLHDPYVSPLDGTIWFGGSGINAMAQLNPRATSFSERWKTFKVPSERNVFIHGNAVDSKGRVYWAEIADGKLGELDPATGKSIRHELPRQGSLLQVVVDSKDNVWYGMNAGNAIGKLDAKTRKITDWGLPVEGAKTYGLAVDPQDNIWTVGRPKHVVMKFDAAKEKWSTYPTPSQPSGTRRIGVDNKGKVWFTEYSIGKLGYLDPDTGQITEYQPQYKWGGYYEAWPDNRGSVWVTDDTYNALIRFDVQTKKFTYYPLPQVRWSVPKVEIDKDGSVWFGSRGIQSIVAVNFKPKGNALKTYRPPERGGFGQSPIAD